MLGHKDYSGVSKANFAIGQGLSTSRRSRWRLRTRRSPTAESCARRTSLNQSAASRPSATRASA